MGSVLQVERLLAVMVMSLAPSTRVVVLCKILVPRDCEAEISPVSIGHSC